MKVLHVSFHRGCQNDVEYVMDQLGHDLTFMEYDDGGISKGCDKYNVTRSKAHASWEAHKEFYNTFDVVVTSDTTPISRIFLQNNWPSPSRHLVVWICNRFDYCDTASLVEPFPDPAYYELIRKAASNPYVTFIGYTPFEMWYAQHVRRVPLGSLCIQPIGQIGNTYATFISTSIPQKADTLFVGPYHNDNIMMDLAAKARSLGIQIYQGRYNGPLDLAEFRGVIHIPYAWSNLALFEALQAGIVYFIPSLPFFKKITAHANFFWSPPLKWAQIELSDWYSAQFQKMFVYFDSWSHLKELVETCDTAQHKRSLQTLAHTHKEAMLSKWRQVLNND